ncbi:cytochrome c3 family protein [Ferrimonas lipolytica]|uniref:Cytochrome c3 family protein n=1 Tax=Ferrimonas lipolytica TaxID=2724191 RepID=A0A6H1UGG5_9GAMM|nr:cytochrome c3 family protein [Ferrimonas lipolytica]QIZ77719.1 cytochrome c3 family protein [Ferrimonas lipolytica]
MLFSSKSKYSLLLASFLIMSSNVALAASSATEIDSMHQGFDTAQQCMECHGSYQENAENTAHLGKWNPHDSIHGGYVDCTNCHQQNKVEKNYCSYCHDYKPALKN